LQARYFSWLEQQLQAGAKISESEGADKLEHYRKYVGDIVGLASTLILLIRQLDLFMGLSFPTISSTGPNGGTCHFMSCLNLMLTSTSNHSLSAEPDGLCDNRKRRGT
jgi:hypothetical protein